LPVVIGRRVFLAGSVASLLQGCSRCGRSDGATASAEGPSATVLPPVVPEAPAIPDSGVGVRGQVKTETWTLGEDGRAVAIVPSWTSATERLPLLIALHGRGEAVKSPALGVMGWPKDYALLRAIERVCAPPLTRDDFEGFVEPERLAMHNAALAKRPFAGIVVVCPYCPDIELHDPGQIREYGDYLTHVVLARANKELPVLGTASSIGIDGVSLGGALSLQIGLARPETFGAVGTLQPAISVEQIPAFTELARAARAKNPKLMIRLLTSKEDYFRRAILSTSQAWRSAGIEHELEDVPGPHDYPFNRGPGSIEMLLWHDRLLARSA
jgi:enterochelin esterase-like enzyme